MHRPSLGNHLTQVSNQAYSCLIICIKRIKQLKVVDREEFEAQESD